MACAILTAKIEISILMMICLFSEQKIIEESLTNSAHNFSNTNLTAKSQKQPSESCAQSKLCLETSHTTTSSSTLSTISDTDKSNSSIQTKCSASLQSHSHSIDDNTHVHDVSNLTVSTKSIKSNSAKSTRCSVTNEGVNQNSHSVD